MVLTLSRVTSGLKRKKETKKLNPFPGIEINPEFKKGLDLMNRTQRHLFITGEGGDGGD